MARTRLISPRFFTSGDIADLPMAARLLFIGMWCVADREGRLEDDPRRLKAEIFPHDAVDIAPLLEALEAADLITRYTAHKQSCLAVRNFHKYQRPHHRETASILPEPPQPNLGTAEAAPRHGLAALDPVSDPDTDRDSETHAARAREGSVSGALYALHEDFAFTMPGGRTIMDLDQWAEHLTLDDVQQIREVADGKPWRFAAAVCGRVAAARRDHRDPWAEDSPPTAGGARTARKRNNGVQSGPDRLAEGGAGASGPRLDPRTSRPLADLSPNVPTRQPEDGGAEAEQG